MTGKFLTRWFRSLVSIPQTIRKTSSRKGFRPNVETLEDLVLLSVTFFPTYEQSTQHAVKPQLGGSGPSGMSPAQIQQAYGFNQITFQNGSSTVAGNGAGETIAIVDAYDNPNIASDLATFDSQFGLAAPPTFTKVGINSAGTGSTTKMPSANSGWAGEISLDVEWAHAIAPGANILLVEANSASDTDLLHAIDYARSQSGVVAVSMSWGTNEFSGETSWDSHFVSPSATQGITYLGSSGDSGSPSIWPALSSHVIGVGGTSLTLGTKNTYASESGWSGSGGSLSSYVTAPTYQTGLTIHSGSTVVSAKNERAGPDVSFDADPNTGVAVYSQYGFGGWAQVGGTSAAAPQWAALVAIADQGLAIAGKGSLDGASQTLPDLYKLSSSDFHDVTTGSNGGYSAGVGFDLVTGLGTPIANRVVADLVSPDDLGWKRWHWWRRHGRRWNRVEPVANPHDSHVSPEHLGHLGQLERDRVGNRAQRLAADLHLARSFRPRGGDFQRQRQQFREQHDGNTHGGEHQQQSVCLQGDGQRSVGTHGDRKRQRRGRRGRRDLRGCHSLQCYGRARQHAAIFRSGR